jgi:thiol-disulfide isomerase/thioredoxin
MKANIIGKQKLFIKVIASCFLISIIWLLTDCDNKTSKLKAKNTETMTMDVKAAFKLPEIPISLNTPEGRSDYLIRHYWDNFDFTDTLSISNPDAAEQFFVDFVDVSSRMSLPTAREGITIFMQRSSQNQHVQNFFVGLLDKYLYDPNSPMRNEELYIPVLEYLVNSPKARIEDKVRAEYRLKMALRNRPGDVATNFEFAEGTGKVRKLSDVKNEYVLLYFNNPGCSGCREVTAQIAASAFSKSPKLTILAVYPDNDLAEWKKAQYEIPGGWINGYSPNGEVMEKELYDLKAIPTLYLLNKDRKVVLKDAAWEQIEMYLSQNLM